MAKVISTQTKLKFPNIHNIYGLSQIFSSMYVPTIQFLSICTTMIGVDTKTQLESCFEIQILHSKYVLIVRMVFMLPSVWLVFLAQM
jgi:hypothetical protein